MKKVARKSLKKAEVKTAYGVFSVVFERERDMGGYAVEAMDVQGAVSWGKTIPEAKKMIAEAIEGIIEARVISDAVKKGNVSIRRPAALLAA